MRATEELERERALFSSLRSWAAAASSADAVWDGLTAEQKDAALRLVIRRFGLVCDGLATAILRGDL